MCCHFLLQVIFLTQRSNLDLPHCRQTLYCLSHQWSGKVQLLGFCFNCDSLYLSLSSFKNLFIFNWKIIALQYCIGFCCVSTWISHRYTCIRSLLNLPPTSHPIPLLWVLTEHQIWAPCVIQQISTGYLILHMIMYMLQCYSLNSSHPLLLLLCAQVCSLCFHLHLYPANRFIGIIFLDSIYMHWYTIFVFLFLRYFTLYGTSLVSHLVKNLPAVCET